MTRYAIPLLIAVVGLCCIPLVAVVIMRRVGL